MPMVLCHPPPVGVVQVRSSRQAEVRDAVDDELDRQGRQDDAEHARAHGAAGDAQDPEMRSAPRKANRQASMTRPMTEMSPTR